MKPDSAVASVSVSTNSLAYVAGSATGVTNLYAYDALERRVAETDGRGNTTRTAYDSLGRFASVSVSAGGSGDVPRPLSTFAYTYLPGTDLGEWCLSPFHL